MIFNNHSNLEGQHAFLGASKYHWINYDETKVADAYSKFLATQRGTVLHDFACQCITLGQKLPKSQKTLNMYVNDAISFRMVPEQILFYSENCFGTADTIVFRNGTLRIHDLKTGVVPAHMEQLEIYAALFLFGIQGETIGNRDGTSSVSEQRNSVSHTYCRRYCSNHGQDYYFRQGY